MFGEGEKMLLEMQHFPFSMSKDNQMLRDMQHLAVEWRSGG
ncbi:hypothetical protein SAMN05518855_101133 [Paenibacillus sp. CF384]|nr:hypothetical protein SAMN05518855_101133 [Paenibacillus sp. CF384]